MIRFLPIFIVAVVGSTHAAEPAKNAKEHSNEETHNHSNHDDHDKKSKDEKSSDHQHSDGEEGHADHDHAKGEDEHKHAEGEGHSHDEGEEENAAVGPEKGIVEANDKNGFKLSPEAFKNFELKFTKISGKGPWSVPATAIVLAGEEVNIFRRRDGFFKRIDFQAVRKSPVEIALTSKDLAPGDEIVVSGLGFLRIAELAAFGGVAHGHSH